MSSTVGNAGEHLAMAELLLRGFDAYMADRGNPAYDIACLYRPTRRSTVLRVKTCTNETAVWNQKKSGDIFLDLHDENDFVLIVNVAKGITNREVYVVPTPVMDRLLRADFELYVSCPGHRGVERSKDSSMRRIHFDGEDRPDNTGYAYRQKLADYYEGWDLLK